MPSRTIGWTMEMKVNPKAARHGGPPRPLRVLIVEDSEFDAQLLLHALERGGFSPNSQIVQTCETMEAALDRTQWDFILADHAMPEFSALAALELVKKRGLDLPFIIVSGQIEEETAVSAMKAGAHDYVMKGRLARLVPAVEREGWKIVVLSQLHPLFPTSLITYLYGLSRIPFRTYLIWVTIGRVPGLFLYVYLGTLGQYGVNLAQGKTHPRLVEYWIWGGAFVVSALILFVLGRVATEAMERFEPPDDVEKAP